MVSQPIVALWKSEAVPNSRLPHGENLEACSHLNMEKLKEGRRFGVASHGFGGLGF